MRGSEEGAQWGNGRQAAQSQLEPVTFLYSTTICTAGPMTNAATSAIPPAACAAPAAVPGAAIARMTPGGRVWLLGVQNGEGLHATCEGEIHHLPPGGRLWLLRLHTRLHNVDNGEVRRRWLTWRGRVRLPGQQKRSWHYVDGVEVGCLMPGRGRRLLGVGAGHRPHATCGLPPGGRARLLRVQTGHRPQHADGVGINCLVPRGGVRLLGVGTDHRPYGTGGIAGCNLPPRGGVRLLGLRAGHWPHDGDGVGV